jgi:hypothetical protein
VTVRRTAVVRLTTYAAEGLTVEGVRMAAFDRLLTLQDKRSWTDGQLFWWLIGPIRSTILRGWLTCEFRDGPTVKVRLGEARSRSREVAA